ncbi:MAG: coproporphyrinogen III oxidase [Leptospiraceae bacterium]|nr:MAG: coproporphyrinogen III oxidase [Leptospiraceae bacterium]
MIEIKRKPNYLGIYIHFPFCLQKCHYCDFYSLGLNEHNLDIKEIEKIFIERILEEFLLRYPYFKEFNKINTIYFGGGTASFLSAQSIKKLLQYFKDFFLFTEDCEITLEGNPEHLYDKDYLLNLKEIGINRINVGYQTKQFNFLQKMNRYYNPDHYEKVLYNISSIFDNWGVDLIYGFPDQTLEDFKKDLDFILSFPLKHLSLYSLTVEHGTMYEKLIHQNFLKEPNQNLQEEIFLNLPSLLKNYAFIQYEISNFAKKNYECRHNLRYWLYEPYLGLGPSSHGFNGKYRYNNYRNWLKWLKNFHENYTIHEPLKEIAITMFRLCIPINLKWIENITKHHQIFLDFFMEMANKEFGTLTSLENQIFFQWNLEGISLLDNKILEFFEKIDQLTYIS